MISSKCVGINVNIFIFNKLPILPVKQVTKAIGSQTLFSTFNSSVLHLSGQLKSVTPALHSPGREQALIAHVFLF